MEKIGNYLGIAPQRRQEAFVVLHDHLQRWREASKRGLGSRFGHILRLLEPLASKFRSRTAEVSQSAPSKGPPPWLLTHEILIAHRRAMLRYHPGPYSGKLLLFWPEQELPSLRGDPTAGWSAFASDVVSHHLPGGHLTCLTNHADAFADQLLPYLPR